jgi:hypothetical protein
MARRQPGRRLALALGLTLALALAGPARGIAQDEVPPRVKAAQEAARANESAPGGREWKRQSSHAIDRLMILVLNRCLPQPPDDEIPQAFSVYVRLSRSGRALEIVTELDADLGRCMTGAARGLSFPEAPRDEYWIQVNLAAPL